MGKTVIIAYNVSYTELLLINWQWRLYTTGHADLAFGTNLGRFRKAVRFH